MKNGLLSALFVSFIVFLVVSCQKNSAGFDQGGKTSIWPIKTGNTWIYKDSVFNDTAVTNIYLDTATIGSPYVVAGNGQVMWPITEQNGWFGSGSYVGVDPYNSTVYEIDSTTNIPYIFFGLVDQDGELIGTGNDYSNPTCPNTFTQYGFISTSNVAGYSCVKNILYTTNCSNINTEAVVIYLSPGVGIVRIEDYESDSVATGNLHLSYSQTLQSSTLH